jgi:hypothetical protein
MKKTIGNKVMRLGALAMIIALITSLVIPVNRLAVHASGTIHYLVNFEDEKDTSTYWNVANELLVMSNGSDESYEVGDTVVFAVKALFPSSNGHKYMLFSVNGDFHQPTSTDDNIWNRYYLSNYFESIGFISGMVQITSENQSIEIKVYYAEISDDGEPRPVGDPVGVGGIAVTAAPADTIVDTTTSGADTSDDPAATDPATTSSENTTTSTSTTTDTSEASTDSPSSETSPDADSGNTAETSKSDEDFTSGTGSSDDTTSDIVLTEADSEYDNTSNAETDPERRLEDDTPKHTEDTDDYGRRSDADKGGSKDENTGSNEAKEKDKESDAEPDNKNTDNNTFGNSSNNQSGDHSDSSSEKLIPVGKYALLNYEAVKKIRNAEKNATVKIGMQNYYSFHKMVFEALSERTDVTLVVNYTYKNTAYVLTIPAGSITKTGKVTLESLTGKSNFAGFLYLGKFFKNEKSKQH